MRIFLRTAKSKQARAHRLLVLLPSCIVFSGFSASIVSKILDKHRNGICIGQEQLKAFFKEIRRMRKMHPRLYITDIESSQGDKVRIRL